MKNFYLFVIGCQQNEFEATRIAHLLKSLGFTESSEKEADLIIAISCAVRQTAVDRIIGKVRLWKNKQVIITGCIIDHDKKILEKSNISFWDIAKPEKLAELLKISDSAKLETLLSEGSSLSKYVPIMTGCNNFCSYCAVPYTRGREKSRSFESIINDVKNIISHESFVSGSEIMLLGQNVNSYEFRFAELLHELNALEGNFVISFISNHPKDMSDEIIEAVARLPKIKKEIHLPVQSGSNKILKAMNRPYTKEQYLKLIKKIREVNKDIAITTDVIIGFPGESEKDFEETIDVFEQVGYKMAYINKYSPRKGTAAYSLGDPIPWKEKQRRWHILDKVLKRTMY